MAFVCYTNSLFEGSMSTSFRSVKIASSQYERLKSLSDLTGHSIGFHLNESLKNYMTDVAPVWEQAAKDVRKNRKTVTVS